MCLGIKSSIDRKDIHIGRSVFVGAHSVIKGGANVGDYSVIAAGTIVDGVAIPPYSLVYGNPMRVKKEYYKKIKSMSHA
jgi:acetyltransferase-like isoleucine patch superfamily enzyme